MLQLDKASGYRKLSLPQDSSQGCIVSHAFRVSPSLALLIVPKLVASGLSCPLETWARTWHSAGYRSWQRLEDAEEHCLELQTQLRRSSGETWKASRSKILSSSFMIFLLPHEIVCSLWIFLWHDVPASPQKRQVAAGEPAAAVKGLQRDPEEILQPNLSIFLCSY